MSELTHHVEVPATVPGMCLEALSRHAKSDALSLKQQGQWLHIPGAAIIKRVRAVALGLSALGVRKGDRVALLSENRPDWSVVDLAILSLGAINVPIYTTQAPEQVRFILEDSGARLLFVSGRKVYRHARPGIEPVERLECVVFFDTDAAEAREGALTLFEVEQRGAELDRAAPEVFDRALASVAAADLATIIYTSGTTGEPKGVCLTHANFVSNVLSISSALPISSNDVALSVLPLSHIFERTVFYVFCWNGVSVYYAASFDQVASYLQEVRPTIMTAVPRLFEKVYHRIMKRGESAGGWRRKMFKWAMKVGPRYAELKDKRRPVPPLLEVQQGIASRLVFAKWRAGIGGRLRYFVSGGAPLSPALSYAFLAADIPILQGYGMTETCIVSANRPDNNRVGSVGLPFPGIAVSLAPDGEILVRGPNVMPGYFRMMDETREVFTEDGWFKTGDVGRLDEDGRLYITDRKKELFKLSNGKYVAPQLIESVIKQSALV
nr:long-chain fatty acid--CoA ligase [Acidobacteriota bacterium]